MRLSVPEPGPGPAASWVADHLGDLAIAPMEPSKRFRGGQSAADARLAAFDVAGYASTRNEVWPLHRRGASGLSPYIRHGLLTLGQLWDHVSHGPARDRTKFRDELLWQEFSRHLYARLGPATQRSLRHSVPERAGSSPPWGADHSMACISLVTDELAADGWLVNQTRMWLASHWTVRHGGGWRDGDDWLFARLLDGSRAANRLGWQWTVGASSSAAYGFSRTQVERRAPGLCAGCRRTRDCPIATWPDVDATGSPSDGDHHDGVAVQPDPRLGAGWDDRQVAGPSTVWSSGDGRGPEAVWLTAESLGDDDPALAAHPDVPAVFVFDDVLLARIGLTGMRLAFMVETLADLATRRRVELWRGDPVAVLANRPVAATCAPVPGWARRRKAIGPVEVFPWPWLVPPNGASLRSFSAWRKATGIPTSGS
jgi:deoxyribodipyrimidine photo-lyase